MRADLILILGCFPEWPVRPLRNRPECKGAAIAVVVDGNLCEPLFHGDPRASLGRLIGYTKAEYTEAGRILAREQVE